jgi:hypothetical protein
MNSRELKKRRRRHYREIQKAMGQIEKAYRLIEGQRLESSEMDSAIRNLQATFHSLWIQRKLLDWLLKSPSQRRRKPSKKNSRYSVSRLVPRLLRIMDPEGAIPVESEVVPMH